MYGIPSFICFTLHPSLPSPPSLPPDFLGEAKLSIRDLLRDGDSPWTKRLLLEGVPNGEIELRIALELNEKDLLL